MLSPFPYICLSFSLSLLFRQSLLYDSQFNISIRTRLISTHPASQEPSQSEYVSVVYIVFSRPKVSPSKSYSVDQGQPVHIKSQPILTMSSQQRASPSTGLDRLQKFESQPVFSTVPSDGRPRPSVRDFSRTDGRRQGRPSPSFLKTDGMSAVIHRHRAVTVYL